MDYYLSLSLSALQRPKVTVGAVITIDADLEEISQHKADEISAVVNRKRYIATETLTSTDQGLYLQTTYKRLFNADTISTEMYERLRSINTLNSRTVNYTRKDLRAEMKNTVKPFTDQLYYNEVQPNKIDALLDSGSPWLARLLTQDSITEYTPVDVPITGVAFTLRHLVDCNQLPHKCVGYCLQ